MPGPRGLLVLGRLTGVLADHPEIPIEGPEQDFGAGGLRGGGNQEVDRWAAVASVRGGGELTLHFQCPLDTRIPERDPLERREQSIESLPVSRPGLGSVHGLEDDGDAGENLARLIAIGELLAYVGAL